MLSARIPYAFAPSLHEGYIRWVACQVEYTDDFEEWWNELNVDEQESIAASVGLLEQRGVSLGHPHSSQVKGSRHGHMRELRIQHHGEPYRIFYAFDPRRMAMLLIGGNKGGDDRFYDAMIPRADKIYDEHLQQLVREDE
jgi:hypothetical protein